MTEKEKEARKREDCSQTRRAEQKGRKYTVHCRLEDKNVIYVQSKKDCMF